MIFKDDNLERKSIYTHEMNLRAIAAKVSDPFQNLVKAANNVSHEIISYVSHDICQDCLELTK